MKSEVVAGTVSQSVVADFLTSSVEGKDSDLYQ